MENKAELEMKAAVMAYCEEVCPDTYKPRVLYDGFVAIWRKLKWNLSPYFEVTVGKSTIVLDDEFTNWGFMYTALGLDALDMHKENLIRITKQRMSAINGAMRWESRAWKLLQIAKDKSMESFAHSIRIAKLEADLATVGKTEQNPTLTWEQTFKANPWDGVSVCATYMGLDFNVELQDDGRFEMSVMVHGALYGFGKVAIRQRAINQMDKIFNEMLQSPIDVMRIAERYAKD